MLMGMEWAPLVVMDKRSLQGLAQKMTKNRAVAEHGRCALLDYVMLVAPFEFLMYCGLNAINEGEGYGGGLRTVFFEDQLGLL